MRDAITRGLGILVLAVLGCAALGGELELEVADEPEEVAPLAVVPLLGDEVARDSDTPADSDAPEHGGLDCLRWAAGLDADHRDDVRALCGAPTYDGNGVGIAGVRTASREAVECLLDLDVPTEWFVALSRAGNPVTRMYAREAIHRRDAWTRELVHVAMLDSVQVPARDACVSFSVTNSELGYAGAAGRDDVWPDLLMLESNLFDQANALALRYREDRGCRRWQTAVHCSGDCYVRCPSRTRCDVWPNGGTVTCDAPMECSLTIALPES